MIEFITSRGWTMEWGSERCPPGFIEFHHKRRRETFWRLTILEAYQEMGGL